MAGERRVRGWVVVLILAVLGLAFYFGGDQAVSELTANGELRYTESAAP